MAIIKGVRVLQSLLQSVTKSVTKSYGLSKSSISLCSVTGTPTRFQYLWSPYSAKRFGFFSFCHPVMPCIISPISMLSRFDMDKYSLFSAFRHSSNAQTSSVRCGNHPQQLRPVPIGSDWLWTDPHTAAFRLGHIFPLPPPSIDGYRFAQPLCSWKDHIRFVCI